MRLEQMIMNIIDNPFKYTPEGCAVDISVQVKNGEAVFVVRDTGVGIAPDYLSKIFEVFVQGPRENRIKGGLGMGLAVVRSLAAQHGATVVAESQGVGTGSTFTMRFPLSESKISTIKSSSIDRNDKTCKILVIEENHDAGEMLCSVW